MSLTSRLPAVVVRRPRCVCADRRVRRARAGHCLRQRRLSRRLRRPERSRRRPQISVCRRRRRPPRRALRSQLRLPQWREVLPLNLTRRMASRSGGRPFRRSPLHQLSHTKGVGHVACGSRARGCRDRSQGGRGGGFRARLCNRETAVPRRQGMSQRVALPIGREAGPVPAGRSLGNSGCSHGRFSQFPCLHRMARASPGLSSRSRRRSNTSTRSRSAARDRS